MQSESQTKAERRRFFRIDDEVKLIYQRQDQQPFDTAIGQTFPLLTGLELINQDASKQLRKVERIYPEMVAYVKTLESKLDFIARGLLLTQEPELMQQSNRRISISATGMAFDAEICCSIGEILALKMVLLSSMIFIVNPVKVIYCTKIDSDTVKFTHHMGVDFINMDESIREQLIRHIFSRQQAQRRELI